MFKINWDTLSQENKESVARMAGMSTKFIGSKKWSELKPYEQRLIKLDVERRSNNKTTMSAPTAMELADFEEKMLLGRLRAGSFSAYTTTGMSEFQKKLLDKWVRQGKVLKLQNPSWSGPGNRYNYYLKEQIEEAPKKSKTILDYAVQTPLGKRMDKSRTAKQVYPNTAKGRAIWRKHPNRSDLAGVDVRLKRAG